LHLNSGLPEFSILKSAASRVHPTCGVKLGNDAELDRFDRNPASELAFMMAGVRRFGLRLFRAAKAQCGDADRYHDCQQTNAAALAVCLGQQERCCTFHDHLSFANEAMSL
jgi:hypothetical protein